VQTADDPRIGRLATRVVAREGVGGCSVHSMRVNTARLSRAEVSKLIQANINRLQNGDEQTAFEAARDIGGLGSKIATRPLIRTARNARHAHGRVFAIFALRQLHDRRALNVFIECSRSGRTPAIRDEAVEALGWFISKNKVRALKAALAACRDESAEVRWTAAFVLANSSAEVADRELRRLLGDAEHPQGRSAVQDVALESLEATGKRWNRST
jgi:HEAT repeat protein